MFIVRLRTGHIDDYIGVVGIVSCVSRIPLLSPCLSHKNRGTVASKRYHTKQVVLGILVQLLSAFVLVVIISVGIAVINGQQTSYLTRDFSGCCQLGRLD